MQLRIVGGNNTQDVLFAAGGPSEFSVMHGEAAWAREGPNSHTSDDRQIVITSFNKVMANSDAYSGPVYDLEGNILTDTTDPVYKAWKRYRALQTEWRFVGVVNTPYINYQDPGQGMKDHEPVGIAVMRHGTITVTNYGNKDIKAGCHVRVRLPGNPIAGNADRLEKSSIPAIGGTTHLKAVALYEPVDHGEILRTLLNRVLDAELKLDTGMTLSDALKLPMGTPDEQKANGLIIQRAKRIFNALYKIELGAVVGVALSNARPGHRFDLMVVDHS